MRTTMKGLGLIAFLTLTACGDSLLTEVERAALEGTWIEVNKDTRGIVLDPSGIFNYFERPGVGGPITVHGQGIWRVRTSGVELQLTSGRYEFLDERRDAVWVVRDQSYTVNSAILTIRVEGRNVTYQR